MSLLGVSPAWKDLRGPSLMSLRRSYSYVVIKDFEGKDYLVMKNAGNDLWPKLLYQYSNTGHTRLILCRWSKSPLLLSRLELPVRPEQLDFFVMIYVPM